MEEKAGIIGIRRIDMVDGNGRIIDYLRISLTDRCNLRCIYCMPEEGTEYIPHSQILTYDEILRICRCMSELGLKKIKLTGGEPLVRKDCAQLIRELKKIPQIEQITLTTNGVCLKKQMHGLAEAGLDAVNISLDTLDSDLFLTITRQNMLNEVWEGIKEALCYPKIPVKINCVPVFSDTKNILDMAGLAKHYPLHVRFIELMPIGYGKSCLFQSEEEMKKILSAAYGTMVPCEEKYGNGPCRYYSLSGFQGKIGFISAVSHQFCSQCNRIRLTSDGYLKTCLQYAEGVWLKEMMREGCSDKELKEKIIQAVKNKPGHHQFSLEKEGEKERKKSYDKNTEEKRFMSQIGG